MTEQDALRAVESARVTLAAALAQLRQVRGEPATEPCGYCEGSGKDPVDELLGEGEQPCEDCQGTGQVDRIYPLIVNQIDWDESPALQQPRAGKPVWVKIRPCAQEYGNKTYLGYLLGRLAVGMAAQMGKDGALEIRHSGYNPAIFVPELGKVIHGMESWWAAIKSPEDLQAITDADINSVWYVQALKAVSDKASG